MSKEFQDELLKKLPEKPSDEVISWWFSSRTTKEAVVYRSSYVIHPSTGLKEKMVKCKCTACGEEYFLDYVPSAGCSRGWSPAPFGFRSVSGENIISGDSWLCQECGTEVHVMHIGNYRYEATYDEGFPLEIRVVDGLPCCIRWRVTKSVDKDVKVNIRAYPNLAFVFKEKKAYRYVGFWNNFGTLNQLNKWESRYTFSDDSWTWDRKDVYKFPNDIWDDTIFKNSKFQRYLRDAKEFPFLISYLRTFQKHPQIENLVTAGASSLVSEYIRGSGTPYTYALKDIREGLNFKENKPSRMLGLSKPELRTAIEEKWEKGDIETFVFCKNSKFPIDMRQFRVITAYFTRRQIREMVQQGKDPCKTYRYMEKQKRKHLGERLGNFFIFDYWRMAEELKLPLETERDIYPQNITKAHDECVRIQNERKEEDFFEKEAKERKCFSELSEKYEDFYFEADGYCIFIAKQPRELRSEGRYLSHCVGRYVKTHAKGKSLIFFLRRSEEPDVPYFTVTLNVELLKITMNLGKFNCDPPKEVEEFAQKWEAYIREVSEEKKLKKEKRKAG